MVRITIAVASFTQISLQTAKKNATGRKKLKLAETGFKEQYWPFCSLAID
jgi:hypothetical protein